MKSMKLIGSAILAAATACTANEITAHPANAELQRAISEIVKRVRLETGAALFDDLKRLVAYDVFAVEQVTPLASDPNARIRGNALWVLAQIRDPERKDLMAQIDRTLKHGLTDVEPAVRFEAASGLAARGDWDVIPVLIDGLDNADSGIRYRCHAQLMATTSCDFGFGVDDAPEQRSAAVARWRTWYSDWRKSRT